MQFVIGILLATLPFLGFPIWLDSIFISLSGIFIASSTFLTARKRRLNRKPGIEIPENREKRAVFENMKKTYRDNMEAKTAEENELANNFQPKEPEHKEEQRDKIEEDKIPDNDLLEGKPVSRTRKISKPKRKRVARKAKQPILVSKESDDQ